MPKPSSGRNAVSFRVKHRHASGFGWRKQEDEEEEEEEEENCGDKGMQEQIGIGGDETLLHVYGFLFPSLLR